MEAELSCHPMACMSVHAPPPPVCCWTALMPASWMAAAAISVSSGIWVPCCVLVQVSLESQKSTDILFGSQCSRSAVDAINSSVAVSIRPDMKSLVNLLCSASCQFVVLGRRTCFLASDSRYIWTLSKLAPCSVYDTFSRLLDRLISLCSPRWGPNGPPPLPCM
jgi:hypothetical protein